MKPISTLLLTFAMSFQLLEGHAQSHETPLVKYLKPVEISESDSGLELIDAIYVINLDERAKKWKRACQLFNERALRCNRFSAVNGWKLPIQHRLELAGPYPLRMKGGALGCLLSHVSVIHDAYERGLEIVWVCEDDIEFIDDERRIPELIAELTEIDPDWDILYTDCDMKDSKGNPLPCLSSDFRPDQDHFPLEYYLERTPVNDELVQIRQRYGTHSYIVSRSGMKKIMDHYTQAYLWTELDIDIHYIPGIREYAPTKEIVTNWWRNSISDTISKP